MPTATKFVALGVGNGFPQWGEFDYSENPPKWVDGSGCLRKIDVSGYDLVSPMTLTQASKMFWNLHKVAGSASAKYNIGQPNEFTETVNMNTCLGMTPWSPDDPDFYILDGAPATEPKDRACNRITITETFNSFYPEETSVYYYQAAVPAETPDLSDPAIFILIYPPIRYYSGDVTDEANFTGYGFNAGTSAFTNVLASSDDGVSYKGYASAIQNASSSSFPATGTWAATTVSGIPVLEFTQTDGNEGSSVTTLGEFDFYTY